MLYYLFNVQSDVEQIDVRAALSVFFKLTLFPRSPTSYCSRTARAPAASGQHPADRSLTDVDSVLDTVRNRALELRKQPLENQRWVWADFLVGY